MDSATFKVALESSIFLSLFTDEELMSFLAHGCGTTVGELADPRNAVRCIEGSGLEVQGAELPLDQEAPLAAVAAAAAAHAVFYCPFRGPSKTLMEVIYYRAVKGRIPLSKAAKKVLGEQV